MAWDRRDGWFNCDVGPGICMSECLTVSVFICAVQVNRRVLLLCQELLWACGVQYYWGTLRQS
jgi:hypothetical protein